MNFTKGSHLFGNLSILHRFGKTFVKNQLKVSEIDCSPPYLMSIFQQEGLSQDDLSNLLRIDKGAVAKTTKSMAEKGYIKRIQCQSDKRKYTLFLTEKGKNAVPQMTKIENDFGEVLTQGMSEKEKEELHRLLTKAAKNILTRLGEGGSCNEKND